MANIVRLGSIFADGAQIHIGSDIKPEMKVDIRDPMEGNRPSICWVVADGKLIADRCLVTSTSFSCLKELGLVSGTPVKLNGQPYIIRMLKNNQEWIDALDAVGKDNGLWNWLGQFSFLQEGGVTPDSVAGCGGYAARGFDGSVQKDFQSQVWGWRPVLVSMGVFFSGLQLGQLISVWGGNSLVQGKLKEIDDYDLVLQCSSIRGLCDKDIGTFAAHLPGYGYRIVINKAAVAGLKLIKSVG